MRLSRSIEVGSVPLAIPGLRQSLNLTLSPDATTLTCTQASGSTPHPGLLSEVAALRMTAREAICRAKRLKILIHYRLYCHRGDGSLKRIEAEYQHKSTCKYQSPTEVRSCTLVSHPHTLLMLERAATRKTFA